MSDKSKPVRHEAIYQLLSDCEEHALSATEITERLQDKGIASSRKTITRDLAEMDVSFGICSDGGYPEKFFKSQGHKRDYQLNFSESELQTMILALEGLKIKSSMAVKTLCTRTETILLSKLQEADRANFNHLKSLTIFTPAFRGESDLENPESFKLVMTALKQNKVIRCENNSPYAPVDQEPVAKKYSPLFLNLVGGENYLWVHDHEDNIPKQLKICRLQNIVILDEKVDNRLRKNLGDINARIGGFGGPNQKVVDYTVRCDRTMALLFKERKIHHSQKVIGTGNEWVIKFQANESFEIFRYLAGWAKHIRSLEPESLRKEVEEIWDAGRTQTKKKVA